MQTVDISKFLRFRGEGDYNLNLKGCLNPHRIFREWNFKELALDLTNQYTVQLDTTSVVALAAGGITLTTAATEPKSCSISFGGLFVKPAKNPVVEFKFQIDVITYGAINAVLTDATSVQVHVLPFLISGSSITDYVTNAVGFCYDSNQTTKRFYIVNCNAGTNAGTVLSATQAPFAIATDITVRIRLDTTGKAYFYYNGKDVGSKALAVATTSALVPYIGIANENASAHVATLRYVRLWEDA